MRCSFLIRSSLVILVGVATAIPAWAAEITHVPGSNGQRDMIIFKGRFERDDDKKFKKVAFDLDEALVVLDSPGGLIEPALEIGRAIRFKGFGTAVINSKCGSACAVVWLAGRPRSMTQDANIGFHAVWVRGEDGKPERESVGNALVGAYLNNLGLGDSVITFVTTAGPNELKRLTKSEADALGLPVEVIDNKREAYAKHNLAIRYRWGEQPDLAESARNYRFAAEEGYAGSQNNLGDYYETGLGLKQNDKFAVYWYARAAERGEPTAYLSLSSFLPKETADTDILIEALKFAILAADKLPKGKNQAKAVANGVALRARLSESDQKIAEELAQKWDPLYQESHLMSDTPSK